MNTKKTESAPTSPLLEILWHAKNDDWHKAHELAQAKEGSPDYDRLHAYLHRLEGDRFNASWWYNRINVPFPKISLDEEWELLWQQFS